jgi:cell division protein FtsB
VEAKLAVTTAQEDALERLVSLMRPASLDRDMLEEQVRLVLNYTHPDDVVIYAETK